MRQSSRRKGKGLVSLALALGVAGCGLSGPGPSTGEIRNAAVDQHGDAFVVPVTESVVTTAAAALPEPFPSTFLNAPVLGADVIHPGDSLALTIFENVDDGLLANEHTTAAEIDAIKVDGDGFIFLPYVGRVRAAGSTPERLRQIITARLDSQTPEPQVIVRRDPGDGASVSVLGGVGAQGVYSIRRSNRTLSAMLAAAGGLKIQPELARITVIRAGQRGHVRLEDLYDNPRFDIALRDGDRVLVEEDDRSFIVLGATGTQRRIGFQAHSLSVMEAIAQAGGLSSDAADPEAVFLLRREPANIASRVLGRMDISEPQRVVYAFDLTRANGLFLANDFSVRDEDIIYVGEAAYVSFRRALGVVGGTLGPLGSARNLAD